MDTPLGQMIKDYRRRKNLTQKELADKLGKSYQLVQGWENGRNKPTAEILQPLSAILDIPILDLIALTTDNTINTSTRVAEEPLTEYSTSVKPASRRSKPALFKSVPFLSVRAAAGVPWINVAGCQPDIDDTYPVLADLVDDNHQYMVVEVEGNSMEPELPSGSKVLARLIQPDKHGYESGGVYAVLFADLLVIKRIRTNTLNSNSTLLLHSDNELYGEISVKAEDIQCIWKIACSVFRPIR